MTWLLALVRGGSAAGVVAGVLFAIAIWLGLVRSGSIPVFLLVAAAGVLYWLIPGQGSRFGQAIGSSALGVLAVALGLWTGFGALETSMIAGSALAIGWTWLGRWVAGVRPSPPVVGLVGVGIAVAALIPLVIGGETLGHDESAYALKGKSWLLGSPDTGWSLHRGPVLSAYAYLVLNLGGQEPALRVLGLVSVLGLSAATWWLGSKLGSRWVGAVSGVAILAGPAMLRRGTEFLTDIPTAALLMLCMVVVWREFVEKERLSYGILAVVPLAWLAFYMRYQAILSLGLIGLTILVLWWPRIRSRPAPMIVASSLGFLGLIPHFVFSMAETGSPLGVLRFTGEVAGRDFIGEGLVDYFQLASWPLAGFVGPMAVVFAIWWAVATWRSATSRRRALFLLVPAVGQVLALGVLSHGESRFVFFPLALTVVAGAIAVSELNAAWRLDIRKAVITGLVLLIVGSSALSVASVRRSVQNRILSNEPVELSAQLIDQLDPADTCAVMTSYLPQITFYSSCSTDRFRPNLPASEAVDRLAGAPRFMLLVEDGKRQPQGGDLADLVALTDGSPIQIDGERDDAVIYEFEP